MIAATAAARCRHCSSDTIARQAAGNDQPEQVAMPGDRAAQAQQLLLDQRRLAVRHRERGRAADAGDRRRVVTQPFEFGEHRAQRAGAGRHLDVGDRFDRLAEAEAMGEGGDAGKALGEQQDAVDGLAFGDLLDAAIFVEKPRDRVDDVLADGFQLEMRRLGEIAKTPARSASRTRPAPSRWSAPATSGLLAR